MTYQAWIDRTVAALRALPPGGDVLDQVFAWKGLKRSGIWCEFGVASGGTLRRLVADRGDAVVLGCDSFEGLPEAWDRGGPSFPRGHFACPVPKIANAVLLVGSFAETLPSWRPRAPVTLVHIDCDLYASAIAALNAVGPWLAPGAVIVFDEFWNYEGWEGHEARALYEWSAGIALDWRWVVGGPEAYPNERAALVWAPASHE